MLHREEMGRAVRIFLAHGRGIDHALRPGEFAKYMWPGVNSSAGWLTVGRFLSEMVRCGYMVRLVSGDYVLYHPTVKGIVEFGS